MLVRYSTDEKCEQMEFWGSKQGGSNDYQNNNEQLSNETNNTPVETTDITEDPYKDFGEEITLSSDDLPF